MPTTNYSVWNYASINESGVLIDGVVYFPAYNNTLVPSQQQAELSANGCHVGQGMGMHCHADGYTAQNNNLNLYNDADYVGQTHPPLIGFGFDGIAVYGAYTSQYPSMDGAAVALDEYGGHRHDAASPYHYHSQVMDPPVSAGVPYKLHVLGNVGAWRGEHRRCAQFLEWRQGCGYDGPNDDLGQGTMSVMRFAPARHGRFGD